MTLGSARSANEVQLIEVSGGEAGTANGDAKGLPSFGGGAICFILNVTSAATDATDILAVKIQSTFDGTNWFDVCQFNNVLGSASASQFAFKIHTQKNENSEVAISTALTAGNKRDIMSPVVRVRYTITEGNAAAFDFTVYAVAMP